MSLLLEFVAELFRVRLHREEYTGTGDRPAEEVGELVDGRVLCT